MALTSYKISSLINEVDERNALGIREFFGINKDKDFMPTAATTDDLDEKKYKVVRTNRFVYSGMQTGRDGCIRIGLYSGENPILVSPAYTTFEVSEPGVVMPQYFFMKFVSNEMDRYGAFCSDGSIRSNLDWDVFCNIDLELPPVSVQRKYVNIYNAMVKNQQAYEKGLDDLKLVCDGYIEDLRRRYPCEKIGSYISRKSDKNSDKAISLVMGLSTKKEFREAQSRVNRNELGNYKIVQPGDFAYVPTTDTWKVLAYSFNNFGRDIVVSPVYEVFAVKREKLLPEYLSMWFARKEFDRYTRFHSWGSAREVFTFDDMCEVKIPIPDLSVQQTIVDIYKAYEKRKEINERLKEQIKNICPILIKGAVEEGSRI